MTIKQPFVFLGYATRPCREERPDCNQDDLYGVGEPLPLRREQPLKKGQDQLPAMSLSRSPVLPVSVPTKPVAPVMAPAMIVLAVPNPLV